ncbi:MAG: class beta-lactamase [Mucilaginibacter sp.]|nr:class beta-lactamase [Mucilaginibacter sp.]
MRYYCVMKKSILVFCLIVVFLLPVGAQAQQNSLRYQIAQIAKPAKGIVGVSILNLESGDTVNYNGNARLVMQSVMKFPIALTILHWVDTGKISLNQLIHLKKRDLPKNTFSPLRDKYPKGNVDVSFAELLRYMVSLSDNNACDILLSVLGGTKPVQDYMLRLGIKNVAINASEADMASAWEVQYTNWCKPVEMTQLLDLFYKDKVLSKTNTDFLYNLMTGTTTGPNRIKGMLPAGTVVAHKTGSSGTNAGGLTPATNDVGIITLANGKHIAISVFVCNSTSDEATRDAIIARIAKAAYNYYSK